MTLIPTPIETLNRARADLRMGLGVVLRDADSAILAIAIETLTPERLADLRNLGTPQIAITAWRARTLKAHLYDGDLVRLMLPAGADPGWIRAVADPRDDMSTPMKGPFQALREGSPALHRAAIRLAKTAQLLPAVVLVPVADGRALAADLGLTCLSLDLLPEDAFSTGPLRPVVSARVPMRASEAGRVHVFRPDDGSTEHYAIEIGQPDRDRPVLARLHSACFTGDVLGSLKCDCGPQLNAALELMGEQGAGVLLYLNQEGRGIGLANKMRAYALQDQGFDTVDANHRLGFEDDERDFRIGAAILRRMGFARIRLLTNNPAKVAMMQAQGLDVIERVPLQVGLTEQNRAYLATKAARSGHLL